ncbi:TonB-dependent siderophore receptor [Aliarcobacter butzleri]|uniref:TonB-dependent siderophore receptor n=1 Tax=Aliarcobacter butzleri TaxID=28197 RepID=A0AAW7PUE4_9BACT|nr:TonB-dependent siderophore receptor [Aliarcobacter butzleri]MDN5064520.1 TonB-dependent siderophore receptor [Aliarcobacter butzleri]MDN5065970.1 TonB-dependent siderophore receptor [Aliarcobacter butzleri]
MKTHKIKVIPLSLYVILALGTSLCAQGTTVLEEIQVSDKLLHDITENTGSYTTGSMKTATKLDLSIRETPQSVVVITKQQMEDFNYTSFEDIINNTAGLNPSSYGTETVYMTARGFEIDYYQIDGIPTSRYTPAIDLSMYDRVEVVKGANGLMTGAGNPAASINLVRKHANSKEFTGNITLQGGSWNTYRGDIDVSTPLNQDGSVRARLVTSYGEKDSFKNFYSRDSKTLYGVVDADISDNTRVSIGASYLKQESKGSTWGGLPAFFSDGTVTNFNRKDSFVPKWAYVDKEEKSAFLNLEHYFDNEIKIQANYSYYNTSSKNNQAYMNATNLNRVTGLGATMSSWKSRSEDVDNTLDLYASIPFELGNRNHEIITGIMYQKRDMDNFSYARLTNIDISNNSVYSWDANITEPIYDSEKRSGKTTNEQKAAYVVGRFSLLDDLTLITGGRITNYESDDKFNNYKYEQKDIFIPYAGLVYNIDEHHSIYTSYTDIFQPQDNKDKNGKRLDPREGNNYEAGVKGEYFDKKLNTSLTLFRIEEDNVAQRDPSGAFIPGTSDVASIATEGVTSKGIEIDINGEIIDNWNVGLGYSHFNLKDADNNAINTNNTRTQIMLSSTYKIGQLTFGGSVDFQGKTYENFAHTTGNKKIQQDAFTIVNAMARYEFTKSLSAQLNVNNIFDKEYYANFPYGNQYVYGDPRNATVTLKYKF